MEWTHGVAEAIQLTRTRNTLLLILVEPDSKATTLPKIAASSLHKYLFAHPAIVSFVSNSSLVCLKLVAEDANPDYQSFIQFFTVAETLPQVFLISQTGQVVWTKTGYVSPRQFIKAALIAFEGVERTLPDEEHFFLKANVLGTPSKLIVNEATETSSSQPPAESVPTEKDPCHEKRETTIVTASRSADHSTDSSKPVVAKEPRASLSLGPQKSRLHIRLPDSSQETLEYPPSTPLSAILSAISSILESTPENVILSSAFPRQIYDGSHYSSSLQTLGLHPSATLIATVAQGKSDRLTDTPGVASTLRNTRIAGYVSRAAGVVAGFVRSFVQETPAEMDQGQQNETPRGEPDERTLRFNGNSTQYGYDDGDGRK